MYIIGAGMAGLLAGAFYQKAIILEAKSSIKNNHKAVFRMRSDKIGNFLGIPFKKIKVHKAIWYDGKERISTPRLANLYSLKVTGSISQRSILKTETAVDRWLPPENFFDQLAKTCEGRIIFNTAIKKIYYNDIISDKLSMSKGRKNQPIINTLPMPIVLDAVGYNKKPDFKTKPIFVNQYAIPNCNTHATIYYPAPDLSVYRATINGNILITEGTCPINSMDLLIVQGSFGIGDLNLEHQVKNNNHITQKLIPIDTALRHQIMYELTTQYGIYSLGRYATWRPRAMLDDIFDDIFVINRLMNQTPYLIKKEME